MLKINSLIEISGTSGLSGLMGLPNNAKMAQNWNYNIQ